MYAHYVIVFCGDIRGLHRGRTKAGIDYMSPLLLMHYLRRDDLAYCSMVLYYTHVLRNKNTKELTISANTPSIVTVSCAFEKHLEAWESSKICLEIQAILDMMAFPANFTINKIVAFTCGRIAETLEDRLSPWADIIKWRVSHQHRLICTMQKAFSKRMGARGTQCFAHDPAYTAIDSEHLKMHGITTITILKASL